MTFSFFFFVEYLVTLALRVSTIKNLFDEIFDIGWNSTIPLLMEFRVN